MCTLRMHMGRYDHPEVVLTLFRSILQSYADRAASSGTLSSPAPHLAGGGGVSDAAARGARAVCWDGVPTIHRQVLSLHDTDTLKTVRYLPLRDRLPAWEAWDADRVGSAAAAAAATHGAVACLCHDDCSGCCRPGGCCCRFCGCQYSGGACCCRPALAASVAAAAMSSTPTTPMLLLLRPGVGRWRAGSALASPASSSALPIPNACRHQWEGGTYSPTSEGGTYSPTSEGGRIARHRRGRGDV
jgi:hypothetical protein